MRIINYIKRKLGFLDGHPHELVPEPNFIPKEVPFDPDLVRTLKNVRDQLGSLNVKIHNSSLSTGYLTVLMVLITGFSVIVSAKSTGHLGRQTNSIIEDFEVKNRPYLTFESSELNRYDVKEIIRLEEQGLDVNWTTSTKTLTTDLINTGSLPARFEVKISVTGFKDMVITNCKPVNGVIFPDQEINLCWNLQWDHTSEAYKEWLKAEIQKGNLFPDTLNGVNVDINYSVLGDERFFYTKLVNENYLFISNINDNSKTITKSIEWKVIEAN